MTPTTPTPGVEPHQPGEREAPFNVTALRAIARSDPEDVMRTGALRHMALLAADEIDALRHLAERRAGDVEAVAKVLRERINAVDRARTGRDHYDDPLTVLEVIDYLRAAVKDDAAQIAALTPTRGVSAEQIEAAFGTAKAEANIDGYGDEGEGYDAQVFARRFFAELALGIEVRDAD